MSEREAKTERRETEFVRPAFESETQALAFLALLVFLLLLPVFITESGLISRRDSYESMPENLGAYSFIENEIFDNGEDIDLLFLGNSSVFGNIDTPQVQKALSAALGREARVVTFGQYFIGADINYMQMRDLLERKRVRLVVIAVPLTPYTPGPSATAYRFIRYSDDLELFKRLPFESKMSLYACSVLRAPRDVLTIVRRNKTKPSPYAKNLGAEKSEVAWGRIPENFVRFSPPAPSIHAREMIFPGENESDFQWTNEDIPPHQRIYLQSLVELLQRRQTPLAIINFPLYSQRRSPKIIERKDWSKVFGMRIPVMGVAPERLFCGLDDEEVKMLFFDDMHFNRNGSEMFTQTLLPAILEVYDKHAAKNF
jgi:hypothetical protein